MSSIYSWSTTADDNTSADSAVNWAEGMNSKLVNNSGRGMMGRVAEFIADIGGALSAGGTANAITVTANSAFTAYANGLQLAFTATADNTGATTLNVNSIGGKSIRKMTSSGDAALVGGEIKTGGIFVVKYSTAANSSAGGWILQNPTLGTASTVDTGTSGAKVGLLNGSNTYSGASTFTGNVTVSSSAPAIVLTDTDTGSDGLVSGSGASGSLIIAADTGNEVASSAISFQIDGSEKASLNASGVFTATTFSGSGASLTALPAGQLTGTIAGLAATTGTFSGNVTMSGSLTVGGVTSGSHTIIGDLSVLNGDTDILNLEAHNCTIDTFIRPGSSGVVDVGSSSLKFKAVYATNGTIQTSDAREKSKLRPFSPVEIEASKALVKEIGFFYWLNRPEDGEFAGVTVQRIIEVLEAHGLDAMSYGFISYEEDHYGLSYSGFLCFLAAGFEARLSALEA